MAVRVGSSVVVGVDGSVVVVDFEPPTTVDDNIGDASWWPPPLPHAAATLSVVKRNAIRRIPRTDRDLLITLLSMPLVMARQFPLIVTPPQ
jgi:hypothetical protein